MAGTVPLSRSYQGAIGAAELATAQGSRTLVRRSAIRAEPESLRGLRDELGGLSEEHFGLITPRFERYLNAVASQCGDRVEPARTHLELGFELLGKGLVASGALDPKTFGALLSSLD